ncbi:MAG: DUF2953 domain-containing protein [Butyrivibrio sp.]|nr:DUF2953 domain-containing protein [Butyrivibrio sp.]
MLAGFLTVLKIIGIILLIILAVVLVLLLLVLFVPVMYRLDATVPEMELDNGFDKEKINASARFSWLLFVIRGGIEYPDELAFTLKVFGIKILPKKEKAGKDEDSSKKEENEEATKKDEEVAEKEPESKVDDKTDNQKENESDETAAEKAESVSESTEPSQSSDAHEQTDENTQDISDDADADDSKSFLDVLWKIIDTTQNILKTPLNVLEKIQCTISRVCDKIDMIKSTLENDIFKWAFELVKKKLIKIIKMILPDKCDVKVLFGSGDPATTAEIMGAYGALYPILYNKVEYTPDFERKVVGADVHLKGHITLFTIVSSAAVCFFNKDVKKTIKRFKKIINS